VNHTEESPHPTSDSAWRIFGKLELPVGGYTDSESNTWLAQTLDPLNLNNDILSKICKSIQVATTRVLDAKPDMGLDHFHFLVLIPANHSLNGQAWGFFLVENIQDTAPANRFSNFEIELYLYEEGQ
jgi:hypothetical protein